MYQLSVTIGPGQGGLDPERLQARLRAAEEGGIHSAWTGEAWGPDAITQLALAAVSTKRLLLGSAIVNVYSRTPAALAQHFATLDIVSGGRMLLGLGTSGANVIEHFHGVPFGRGVRRLREYIEIINLLMAGTPLNYEGELFRMSRGFTFRFQPLRPHIPILVASLNPASVRMTARHADGWLPIWIPIDRLAGEVRTFRETATRAGRDPSTLLVRAPGAVTLTRDVESARQAAKGQVAFYISRMGVFYYRHIARLCGEELVARIKRAFDEGGSGAGTAAVPDELADAMTLVTGSVDQARERLAQQQAAGVDLHQVNVEESDPARQVTAYAALAQ